MLRYGREEPARQEPSLALVAFYHSFFGLGLGLDFGFGVGLDDIPAHKTRPDNFRHIIHSSQDERIFLGG